jgi:hypothetical protein
MTRRFPAVTILVTATLAVSGCRAKVVLPEGFAEAVSAADRFVLYEGLPHQTYEADLLAAERAAKPVRDIGGFPFYRDPLAWREGDAGRLTALLTASGTLEPKNGMERACGGFHPDYAVEWEQGPDRYRALICLHCKEVWVYPAGATDPAEYFVDHHRFVDRLQPLLEGYRRDRPVPPAKAGGGSG